MILIHTARTSSTRLQRLLPRLSHATRAIQLTPRSLTLPSSPSVASNCSLTSTIGTTSNSSSSSLLPRYLIAAFATAIGMSTLIPPFNTVTAAAAATEKSHGPTSSSDSGAHHDINSLRDEGIHLNKLLKPSTGKPLLVLIACGSYSPITNMHLLLFEQARNYLMFERNQYDVIGGWLSPVHDAYGKSSLIAQRHRLEMCQAATESSEWLSVQEWEMKQPGWTTTAETLCKYQEALNRAHLTEEPIRVKMLCGADLLESTLVPNLWSPEDLDLIFGTLGVAVIERVGLDLAKLIASNEVLNRYRANIDIVPQRITNTISSTSVRNLIKSQQSIKYLTPDPVIDYIYKHELYGYDPKQHPHNREYLKAKI